MESRCLLTRRVGNVQSGGYALCLSRGSLEHFVGKQEGLCVVEVKWEDAPMGESTLLAASIM